jgi:hypothetical protein
MKKTRITIFCIVALLALSMAGSVAAYNAVYTHTDYMGSTSPTIDGKYTSADEYSAGASHGFGTNGVFRDTWTIPGNVMENMIVETMDTTNDASDNYIICYDSTADGGNTPKTDDFMIKVIGHGSSATCQWYRGSGTAWTAVSGPTSAFFEWKESLATSPTSSTPHYMVELRVDKQDTTAFGITVLGMNFAMSVAYNDTHTGGGVQAWPPTAVATNPDTWGYVPYSMDPVPESIGIGVIIALSSVAVIAGSFGVRKLAIKTLTV